MRVNDFVFGKLIKHIHPEIWSIVHPLCNWSAKVKRIENISSFSFPSSFLTPEITQASSPTNIWLISNLDPLGFMVEELFWKRSMWKDIFYFCKLLKNNIDFSCKIWKENMSRYGRYALTLSDTLPSNSVTFHFAFTMEKWREHTSSIP